MRPAMPPRRLIQVVESGTVVGPKGEEIHTDPHGRVRVQFHWDREGAHDDRSSCWLRVAQPWSGPNYGFQFIPRVGTEVLVSFIGGDTDRPVVVASMPNLASALPHPPPDGVSQSAIRTRSTPGADGYNEILFDDAAGGELLALRAQRNHQENVLVDQLVQVGNDQTNEVGGSREVKVSGNQTTTIGAAHMCVVGGDSTTIITGDVVRHQRGTQSMRNEGRMQLDVGAEGSVALGGSLDIVVGTRSPSALIVTASGQSQLVVKEALKLRSPTSIELSCGSTRLLLTPEGATLKAASIQIEGVDDVTLGVGETELKLDDKASLKSPEIELATSDSSLLLDGDAWVQGGKVYLNCKQLQGKRNAPEASSTPGQITFQVKPPDGYDGPLILVIQTPTGEVIEREADGNNQVVLDGEEGDQFRLIEVRRGDEVLQHLKSE
jgi:type VI secretion system secreted protein VgrG